MKNFLIIITMLLFITSCSSNKTSTLEGGIVESVPVVNVETEVNQEIEVNSGEQEIISQSQTGVTGDDIVEMKKTISKEEVSNHNKKEDCYTIIDDKVYDLTNFFGKHPGGDENILKLCGIDGTEKFTSKHGKNEKAIIKKDSFLIGDLSK